jgi:hypothetical protein
MKPGTLFVTAVVLCLFSLGCTGEECKHVPAVDVSFNPAIITHTRSVQGTYPQTAPFEVWAYYLPKGKKWSSHADEALQLTTKHRVEYMGSEWLPIPALKWPGNHNVTFMASSPQGIEASFSQEKGISIRQFDASSGIMPLFTESIADCEMYNTQGCIALPFMHSLSKVEFEVRSVSITDSVIKLKSLYIDNLMYKGDFHSLPTPRWETESSTMCVEFCRNEMKVGRVSTSVGYRFLMGQPVNHQVVLVVDILDKQGNLIIKDRKIETTLIRGEWHPGKYYPYTLNLTTSSVSLEPDVLDRFDI